jgi:hypothetical protein
MYANSEERGRVREVFERKVLRRIYGPINDNGQWRKLYNDEIKQIYQTPSITEFLRAQRLLWIGHVQRMNESDRVPKKCLLGQPDGIRLRGRSRAHYMELINKDLKKNQITGWERSCGYLRVEANCLGGTQSTDLKAKWPGLASYMYVCMMTQMS